MNITSGNLRSGNAQQAESWKTMMEKVQQTQASLLGELRHSESLISELQLCAALSDFSGSGDIQMNQKSQVLETNNRGNQRILGLQIR